MPILALLLAVNSIFQDIFWYVPLTLPGAINPEWILQKKPFSIMPVSSIWIIAVFVLVEAGILLAEKLTARRLAAIFTILAIINFICMNYLPEHNIYRVIIIPTDIALVFISIKGIILKRTFIKSLFLLSLFESSNKLNYFNLYARINIAFIALKGIFSNYTAMISIFRLCDLIIILTISVQIILLLVMTLRSYSNLSKIKKKCSQLGNGKKVYFLTPFKLKHIDDRILKFNYDDDTLAVNARRILEDHNIFYLSPDAYDKHFRQLEDINADMGNICVIYGHEEDFEFGSRTATRKRLDSITKRLAQSSFKFCILYAKPDQAYKEYLPEAYIKTLKVHEGIKADLQLFDLMNNEITKDIIKISENEDCYKSCSEILESVKNMLSSHESVYLSWICEEITELDYEFDSVKVFYSVLKTLEYLVHLFLIINVAILFDEDEYDELIYNNLENASIGTWQNIINSNKKRLAANELLDKWWNTKIDRPVADKIKELYSLVGIRNKSRISNINDVINFIIDFRNKTIGHGVITPYFINNEINTGISSILKYLTGFITDISSLLEEFEGNLFLNYFDTGYDLSEFVFCEAGRFFLLTSSIDGVKEFLCYKDGYIQRDNKVLIDLGGQYA